MSNVTVQEALKAAEKLIVKAIMFESEAEQYLSESNYELNGCLGDSAADISVNGKAVLAKVRAALAEIEKCEAVAIVYRNLSGQIMLVKPDFGHFDISQYIGATFYTSPQHIEKCEPVAEVEPIGYMSNLAIQRLSQRGLGAITLHKTKTCFNPVYYTSQQPIEKCEPVGNKQTPYSNCQFQICDLPGQCRGEGKCHHPAYPSPQPRDWVVPSNEVIDTLWNKATYESVAHSEPFTRYRFSELLIKQLNTKG